MIVIFVTSATSSVKAAKGEAERSATRRKKRGKTQSNDDINSLLELPPGLTLADRPRAQQDTATAHARPTADAPTIPPAMQGLGCASVSSMRKYALFEKPAFSPAWSCEIGRHHRGES